jgi:phenylacetic acid degradation operon negative regulatory protein
MPARPSPTAPQETLRPLSARSVVLSLLLGVHPPELPVRELVRQVEPFGVAESAARAALSRMVAAGDLHRSGGAYRLSERLVERQRRQDEAVHPTTRAWQGGWECAVVTASGRGPAERAQLRTELAALRLAELREGVWLRPANLERPWPTHLDALVERLAAAPERPARELAAELWPLTAWAATGRALLEHFTGAEAPGERFAAAAAVVRYLLTDPVLPEELLPADWPGPELRAAYTRYQRDFAERLEAGG